jgi:hypothetical protein
MNVSDENEFGNAKRKARDRRQKEVIRSDAAMQAIGSWLFRGSRVYRLSEPDRMLKTKRINRGRETTDVQDDAGRVFYDVSWDSLEFWNPEDYHLADDD